MMIGCCVAGIPLALLGGAKYGLAGATTGWIVGALAVGIPFDRFLEIKFAVLKVRDDGTTNKTTGVDIQ
jgi:hypothetical protein